MAQQFRTGIGQVQVMTFTYKQLDTELILQLTNAMAKRGFWQTMET